ncbi:hypothetical protein SARC_01208 [Sphaeroforma arctica JP610]|uniref:CN hydrolase domain-containing protein n=1 Tax=Sphaeroforma arctica JP610 TaxID=667725 RepID=A0A0L0GCQ9_9EUKA|nr:hypothetical protein SARC_01208 [Sphaeroforma arctica JP610]KNC86671.1 hypothetical protein SARC_01208 [Sphaeroforma arctica JP610]|eukprot:XP_014160573.1 hypothetical protein SARC_01208 [Sphaeroforma arctica JP610]
MFPFQTDNPARVANTHVLLDSSGDVASTYRKMHLFDVDVDGFQFRESEQCVAGNSVVRPTSTPAGNIGLAICYDVRFPELALRLRHMNADVITYPSAFAEGTGKAHWEVLLRARAIENQTYVVAAAQCGYHHPKRKSYGHALIVNPWGEIVASMGGPNADEEGVIYGLIDTDVLSRVRAKMPVIEHRRADIFGEVPQ